MANEIPMAVPSAQSVTPFPFESNDIRTAIAEDGQVWFAAKDVCEALSVAWSGRTLVNMPSNWTCMIRWNMQVQVRDVVFVNEPGVFKLIFRSSKPEAERFANWVCEEVLPSLRKHGRFGDLSAGDEDRLTKTAVIVFKRLTETRDACEHTFLIERAKRLVRQLGQPLIDFKYLGKDLDQLELPGIES